MTHATVGTGEPHHRGLRPSDRSALAVLLGGDPGIGAGRVDHRHQREAVAARERHRAHRLAVPLRIGHAEVPIRPLLDVASLLVADEHDGTPVELPEPGDERRVVGATAIAVELEEVVEDPLDVVEGVRTIDVASELDRLPDLLRGRIGLELVELILQACELAGELRAAQELHAAELTEALAQPHFRFARHQGRSNNRRSRPSVSRRSERGTIASRWP